MDDFYKKYWLTKKSKKSNNHPTVTPARFFKEWIDFQLFPKQMIPVKKVFTPDYKQLSNINEFVIAWGKRGGKDSLIANLLTYIIYFLINSGHPQEILGIKEGENIDIVNVSFDESQAKSVFFDRFAYRVRRTINPMTGKNFFEEQGMNLDRDIQSSVILFPGNIRAFSLNSLRYKGEGKNIVFAVFDEIAQFRFDKADAIRRHIKTTAQATCPRFYKLFYISFLTSGNDYMAHLVNRAEKNEIPHCFYMREATWNLRSVMNTPKGLERYTVKKADFKNFYDEDPENARLMFECKIPKTRKNSFIKQPEKILESIGYVKIDGKKVYRESPLVENKVLVYDDELATLEFEKWFKPFSVWEVWRLEKEYRINPSAFLKQQIEIIKEYHSNSEYFVGIDLSRGVVDCAGIVLGHRYYVLDKIKLYIDLMLAVRARKGQEIDMGLILDFVINRLHYGNQKYGGKHFNIQRIGSDAWNSNLFLNLCERENIEAETISLERTTIPYNTLKDFVYSQDINYYGYPPFLREMEELIINEKGKIDHPAHSDRRMKEEGLPKGSKDISDPVAIICYLATQDSEEGGIAWGSNRITDDKTTYYAEDV